jgi:hypothetical protein
MIASQGLLCWILAALCCAAVAIPFFTAQFPPITDLPQQSAQIRLFLDTLFASDHSQYKIQWFTPYSFSYLLLGLSWALFGPENAGRMAMLAIGLIWIIAIHVVTFRRGRAQTAAILGTLFFFNHVLYWGFYSFAIGWPVFLLWFMVTTKETGEGFSVWDSLVLASVALLLYLSHVLWLIAGLCWLGLYSLVFRQFVGKVARQVACLIPLVIAVIAWYPMFAESSMATPPVWGTGPLERLSYSWLTDAALGGIHGPAEYVIFGCCLGWVALGMLQNRGALRSVIDWPMLLAAGMFFAFALFLPDKYMNTIRFGQRWMPVAAIAFLAAMPGPVLTPVIRHAAALVVVAAFCLITAGAWHGFQHKELSGLKESLASLPESPKVLGLSYVQQSEFVKGRPFIQVFAYSQVLKGGTLNFSFAQFSPCLVVYKQPFVSPWTNGLEWFPTRATEADLRYFDFVLVNGTEAIHRNMEAIAVLTPVTSKGRWRMYRVLEGKPDMSQ